VFADQLPEEAAHFIVERHQSFQPRGERLDFAHGFERGETRLIGRMIFESPAIESVDLAIPADAFVKALPAFIAKPSALNHLRNKRRDAELFPERIVGNRFEEIRRNVFPDVEADDVEQTVCGAFGKADKRPREYVHLFDSEVVLRGEALHS
jgi:hypothetical protein